MVNTVLFLWGSHLSHLAILWCSLYFWCNSGSRKSGIFHSKASSAESCSTAATIELEAHPCWTVSLNLLGFTQSLLGNWEVVCQILKCKASRHLQEFFWSYVQCNSWRTIKTCSGFCVFSVALWWVFCVQPHRTAKWSFQVWTVLY